MIKIYLVHIRDRETCALGWYFKLHFIFPCRIHLNTYLLIILYLVNVNLMGGNGILEVVQYFSSRKFKCLLKNIGARYACRTFVLYEAYLDLIAGILYSSSKPARSDSRARNSPGAPSDVASQQIKHYIKISKKSLKYC